MLPALFALFMVFAPLSLIAIGGAIAVIPEMQNAIAAHGWMDAVEFTHLFAVAQAVPVPNFLVVTLVGWQVAGLAGAAVATVSMIGPSSLLAYALARIDSNDPRVALVRRALVPLALGLIVASGWGLARAADSDLLHVAITIVTTLVVAFGRLNPLWMLGGGAVLGAMYVL